MYKKIMRILNKKVTIEYYKQQKHHQNKQHLHQQK